MENNNLLGKGHKQYVQDQIKLRQEKLGALNKSSEDIDWMNGKTSWVRLASSVNVENSLLKIPQTLKEVYKNANYKAGEDTTDSEKVSPGLRAEIEIVLGQLQAEGKYFDTVEIPDGEQRLELLGLGKEYMGRALAERLVLTGGTEAFITTETENNIVVNRQKRKGLSNNPFPEIDGAYSNSKDFGFRAMPGITSFGVKSKSMGSLNEANLTLKVNDAEQLAIIDTLYLRLGYTMFLEWGNSSYYQNDGTYVKGVLADPALLPEFLIQDTPTEEEIEAVRVTKMRDLDGDGVEEKLTEEQLADFERRVNALELFYQKIQEEKKRSCGNYDALIGRVSNFSWEFNTDGTYTVNLTIISWGDIIESLKINSFYPDIQVAFDDEGNPDTSAVERKDRSALEAFIYEATLPTSTEVNNIFIGRNITASPIKTSLLSEFRKELKLFWIPLTSEVQPSDEHSDALNYNRSSTNSAGKVISAHAQFGEDAHYYYLRFGDLLDFIKSRLLLYVGDAPIVDIDTREATSFCYNPKINVSADPSKVMIKRVLPSFDINVLPKFQRDKYDSWKTTHKLLKKGPFTETFTHEGNPVSSIIEDFDAIIPGTKVIGGDIMNIYFEKEYLYQVVDEKMDRKTGKLALLEFLKELLSTANSCLGGVNKMDVRLIDGRIIQFYDQTPLYGTLENTKQPQSFNIFGVNGVNTPSPDGSFVTNFGLKTELTNEFATSISIGAQANGDVVGEDSTMLSKWNFGLVDRMVPTKSDSLSQNKGEDKVIKELFALRDKLSSLWFAYGVQYCSFDTSELVIGRISGDDVMPSSQYDSLVSLQKEFFTALIKYKSTYLSESPKALSNQIGMLPINLNLEIDGLSGIRIYDQINVDTRFLPSYYPDHLIFIVKGISHKFSGNRWVTSIDTIAQPKVAYQKDPDFRKFLEDSNNDGFGGGSSNLDVTKSTKSLDRGWDIPGEVDYFSTSIPNSEMADALVSTISDLDTATMMLMVMLIEQGRGSDIRGFNHNYGGYDITAGGWKYESFGDEISDGYVYASEGGTNEYHAFVSFTSAESFLSKKLNDFTNKGLAGFNVNTPEKAVNGWYEKWNAKGMDRKYDSNTAYGKQLREKYATKEEYIEGTLNYIKTQRYDLAKSLIDAAFERKTRF